MFPETPLNIKYVPCQIVSSCFVFAMISLWTLEVAMGAVHREAQVTKCTERDQRTLWSICSSASDRYQRGPKLVN